MGAKKRTRPSAIVRAEHHEPPVTLDRTQQRIVREALRLGEDLREELEGKIGAYGRWLLASVFDGDASSALDGKTKNPVWVDLIRRAGGPTLRINRKVLYLAVTIAARDKRITDQAWRGLDGARKELLLPLADDAAIREAAQHVSKFNLSLTDTREFVSGLLTGRGKPRQIRFTAAQFRGRVRTLQQTFGSPAVLRRATQLATELDPEERHKLATDISNVREAMASIVKALRQR